MCVCKQKDIVGVFLQVVQHASFDCKYGTWGFEGCSKRQLSWGFHLTMNDAYERKQPSSLEIAQLTNAVIYIYIYRQDIVNVISSAAGMYKCRLTWDLRLIRYTVSNMKYSQLALLLTCLQASQALILDQQQWNLFIETFWKPHALLCIYGNLIHGPFAWGLPCDDSNALHFVELFAGSGKIKPSKCTTSLEWVICCYPVCKGEAVIASACEFEGLNARSVDVRILVPLRWMHTVRPLASLFWRNVFQCFIIAKKTYPISAPNTDVFWQSMSESWYPALRFLPGELDVTTIIHCEVTLHTRMDILRGIGFMVCLQLVMASMLWTCVAPTPIETKHHI